MTKQELRNKIAAREEEKLRDLVEHIAKTMVKTRRMLEFEGDADKFDEILSESIMRWNKHYASMDRDELFLEAILER